MKMNFAHKAVMGLGIAGASLFNVGCAEDEKPATPVEPISMSANTIHFTRTSEGDIEVTLFPENDGEAMNFTTARGGESDYTIEFEKPLSEVAEMSHPQAVTPNGNFGHIPDGNNKMIIEQFDENKKVIAIYDVDMLADRGLDNKLNVYWFTIPGGYKRPGIDTKAIQLGQDMYNEVQTQRLTLKAQ